MFTKVSSTLLVFQCLFAMVWHSLTLLMVHLIVRQVGNLFVEFRTLERDNLDFHTKEDEGLVIIEPESFNILYSNKQVTNLLAQEHANYPAGRIELG